MDVLPRWMTEDLPEYNLQWIVEGRVGSVHLRTDEQVRQRVESVLLSVDCAFRIERSPLNDVLSALPRPATVEFFLFRLNKQEEYVPDSLTRILP